MCPPLSSILSADPRASRSPGVRTSRVISNSISLPMTRSTFSWIWVARVKRRSRSACEGAPKSDRRNLAVSWSIPPPPLPAYRKEIRALDESAAVPHWGHELSLRRTSRRQPGHVVTASFRFGSSSLTSPPLHIPHPTSPALTGHVVRRLFRDQDVVRMVLHHCRTDHLAEAVAAGGAAVAGH